MGWWWPAISSGGKKAEVFVDPLTGSLLVMGKKRLRKMFTTTM